MFKVSLWSLHCKSYLLIFEKCHGQWTNCEKITKVFPIPSVQSVSRVWLFVTPCTAACQASLSFTISWSLLRLMSIELEMPSKHLLLCCPLFLLPSIFPSIRVFSNESVLCIRWPRYWSFSFSISPSSEYSRLISMRMDWLDLLAVQGTLKSLLQHHSSKASNSLKGKTCFSLPLGIKQLLELSSIDVNENKMGK